MKTYPSPQSLEFFGAELRAQRVQAIGARTNQYERV